MNSYAPAGACSCRQTLSPEAVDCTPFTLTLLQLGEGARVVGRCNASGLATATKQQLSAATRLEAGVVRLRIVFQTAAAKSFLDNAWLAAGSSERDAAARAA